MTVTKKERETYEAIGQKMLTDEKKATQDFAHMMKDPANEKLIDDLRVLQDRCRPGSQSHTQLGNVIMVIEAVKMQFPIEQDPVAPAPATEPTVVQG